MADEQNYATVSGTKVHRSDFAYAPAGSSPSEWKLPIHDASHVRNALARYGQTDLPAAAKAAVYAKIKAAAKKFGVEVSEKSAEDGHSRESGNLLPRNVDARLRGHDGIVLSEVKNGLVKIAVAYTGEYEREGKKFAITPSDLAEIRRNLAGREAPIDYEHLSAAAGAPPSWAKAAGWLRRPDSIEDFGAGRKILWCWAELTPAMAAMVKQKEYRYFSPEIHWNDTDETGEKIGTRLAAGAMTNRPFLKDLPPIELSDADYQNLFGLAAREDGRLAMVALSEGGQLMDLDSVHVPAASKDISVAYHQPGEEVDSRLRGNDDSKKEKTMSKNLKLKKLADGPEKGHFGVFDGDEMLGHATQAHLKACMDDLDGDNDGPKGNGNGDGQKKMAESLGVATLEEAKTFIERGRATATKPEAVLLSEIVTDKGKIDTAKLDELVDSEKVKPSAIRRTLEAEGKVDAAAKAGKILPTQRAHALRLCLSDPGAFKALVEDTKPRLDLGERGTAGDGIGLAGAAKELDEVVHQWMTEHKADYPAALTEVTKRNPDLWKRASIEVAGPESGGARTQELSEAGKRSNVGEVTIGEESVED